MICFTASPDKIRLSGTNNVGFRVTVQYVWISGYKGLPEYTIPTSMRIQDSGVLKSLNPMYARRITGSFSVSTSERASILESNKYDDLDQ